MPRRVIEPSARLVRKSPLSQWWARIGAYVALTKPRIIELLLVTTVPAMMVAARGIPDLTLAVATVVGGTLAAGSANAFNSYWDRDIDQVMGRTAHRPLPKHSVSDRNALIFGLVLGVLAVGLMWVTTNPLSSLLTLGAILFYVVIYTMILKRRTPSNIVWGGAAGCFPVLIGWSAVTGTLSFTAVAMFMIVFFWTPPHYWPLAMRYRDQYEAAGVPMLPVVAKETFVTSRIVIYSWAMVLTSLLALLGGELTAIYLVSAVLLGSVFLYQAHTMHRRAQRGSDTKPMTLFHYSITYLALLFLAMCVDVLIS